MRLTASVRASSRIASQSASERKWCGRYCQPEDGRGPFPPEGESRASKLSIPGRRSAKQLRHKNGV